MSRTPAARRLSQAVLMTLALLVLACGGDDAKGTTDPGRVPVASVAVTPDARTLVVGETAALAATAKDANGQPLAGRAIAWTSEQETIATVSAAGVVTAVAPGVARIDVASEGKHAVATITVERVPVARLDLSAATLALTEGDAQTLVATPRDAAGSALPDRPVAWRSSDATVAAVDATGRVSAIRAGATTITAESEGKTAEAQVAVAARAFPVATVAVAPLGDLLEPGDRPTLAVTITDTQGRVVTDRQVAWTTSDAAVATVSPAGVVTAGRTGRATITATSEGRSGSTLVTVDMAPAADLLFSRGALGTAEIATLALGAPGAAPVKVNAGNVSRSPSASPDGSRIVFFVSMTTPIGEVVEDLYAVDRNGLNIKRLTTAPGVDDSPVWSPATGANLIAFRRLDQTTGRSDIWVMNADGTSQRNLTADMSMANGILHEPAWSPDGQWIAFAQSRGSAGPGRGSLWLMRADGSAKRQLTLNPGNGFDMHPSWSPDGTRIAFQRGGVSIVTVATGAVVTLDLGMEAIQPSWSPDGRHIVFAGRPTAPGDGRYDLYTVHSDGSGLRLRTRPEWGSLGTPSWIARVP